MNNYALNKSAKGKEKIKVWATLRKLLPLMKDEKKDIFLAGFTMLINSGLTLVAPVLIGHTVDTYIQEKDFHGVLVYASILLGMYILAMIANYFQTLLMGTVGQHVLFNLRNSIFDKIQSLPVAFFNQNKTGDLISRINNDTDKINEFFSRSLIQFVSSIIMIVGAGIFIISINWELGIAALIPAFTLLIFTRMISAWMKRTNAKNLKSIGGMSGEIAESLDHFKVIVAFNRRDYFRKKFSIVNEANYSNAVSAGIANNTLTPMYGLASGAAQLIVVAYGIYLISIGSFTLGLLISFLTYISRLYDPLRQMAMVWSNFQMALAAWDRIHDILMLKSNLVVMPSSAPIFKFSTKTSKLFEFSPTLLEFKNVHFGYPDGKKVLHDINFRLARGKTYALVGPTGGGKTTTASLMARLYDPTEGKVLLNGKDMRSYEASERAKSIGFILQEPFLFTGMVRDNILYGNKSYDRYTNKELEKAIEDAGLGGLLKRFNEGLETKISANGNTLSLGQKQLIAFMRAVLRDPELLILDEATANIDTITEQLLEDILKKLPAKTTKVIIAHRLNTIENADEIFFINDGEVTLAGSMQHAVDMLLHDKRKS